LISSPGKYSFAYFFFGFLSIQIKKTVNGYLNATQ